MNYNTIKEMEAGLRKITDIKVLKNNLTFKSQGLVYTCRFIGVGSSIGNKEVIWIDDISASNVRVVYTGDNAAITVTNVVVNKY